MGSSDNRSIDRLDALKLIYGLQKNKEDVSSVKLLKVKAYIIDWLEEKNFISWNKSRTKVSITEEGVEELKERSWI
jgi:hypothetical protein